MIWASDPISTNSSCPALRIRFVVPPPRRRPGRDPIAPARSAPRGPLSKAFGRVLALDDLTLSVPAPYSCRAFAPKRPI
jgi:hypothetical protein